MQPGPHSHMSENAMCERCDEIDEKIERYRRIIQHILDRDFNQRAKALIAELEIEKGTLHPDTDERRTDAMRSVVREEIDHQQSLANMLRLKLN